MNYIARKMKQEKVMKNIVLTALLLGFAAMGHAKPAFTGKDYSGIYTCDGWNALVGDYDITVSLKLNRISSYGKYGAYEYETETENATKYTGQAIADGDRLAISFKFNGKSINGRGQSIGVANVFKDKGRWIFRKRYYEPDDNGGNYGSEYCVFKEPLPELEKKNPSAVLAPARPQ